MPSSFLLMRNLFNGWVQAVRLASKERKKVRMNDPLKPGDRVFLLTPGNDRLDNMPGVVSQVTPYGAVITTEAAATGQYRASHSEMIRHDTEAETMLRAQVHGYTGDICDTCGGCKVRRSGKCGTCDDCGSTTGCS